MIRSQKKKEEVQTLQEVNHTYDKIDVIFSQSVNLLTTEKSKNNDNKIKKMNSNQIESILDKNRSIKREFVELEF